MAREQYRVEIHGATGDAMLQGRTIEELHDDEGVPLVSADFVDGADVGMVQGGSGAGFAAEALQSLRVLGDVVGKEFQSNEPAEVGVFGFVDDAHAAAAEFLNDAVMGDGLADHEEDSLSGG